MRTGTRAQLATAGMLRGHVSINTGFADLPVGDTVLNVTEIERVNGPRTGKQFTTTTEERQYILAECQDGWRRAKCQQLEGIGSPM